jgi:hypothetical protein
MKAMHLNLGRIEALRREKLDQRARTHHRAPRGTEPRYSRLQKIVWSLVQVLRHAWLNVFSLLALAAGVVFIVYVPQTREILANLVDKGTFLLVLAVWAVSIWYSMRVLSSTDFPGDAEAHPAAKGCTEWLNGEAPRLAPFAGLAVIACASSIFFADRPTAAWIPVVAAGTVPLAWGVAWLGDRAAGLWRPLAKQPVYRLSVLVVAAGAAAVAWSTWSGVPHPVRSDPLPWHLEEWLVFVCAALTLVPLAVRREGALAQWSMAAALGVWLWLAADTVRHHAGSVLPLLILALAALGLWLATRRRELLSITEDAATPRFKVGAATFAALGVAFVLQLALVIAFTKAPIALGTWMGTLAIVFLALALCAFFGIVWVFVPKYLTLPSLALVPLIWALPFGNAPDHALRETKFEASPPLRPQLQDHFKEWRAAQLPKAGESPIFFVAAAGGGLRAAYWTAHMLAAADDATCGEFGRHVYAYSGVSGGSLGVAAYLAQRQVWAAKTAADRCRSGRRAEMTRLLGRDFLAPVAGSMLFAEITQRFSPLTYLEEDRGTTLAKAWSTAWDDVFRPANAAGRFDRPFLDVFAALAKDDRSMPVRPAVFINATGVESGQRVIASNVAARIPGSSDLFRPVRQVILKTSGLTLREAVLNSARFTYVSPAATVLGCRPPGLAPDGSCPADRVMLWDRLVDGGYFENSGLATLTDVIRALKPDAPGGPRKSQLYLIVIDNGAESGLACPRPAAIDGDAEEAQPPAGVAPLSGVTAPIEALLNVREARARLEVRRLRLEFNCRQHLVDWNLFGDQTDRKGAIEALQEPALGWFLSARSANWMRDRVAEVTREFPFRLAPCRDGRPAAPPVRALLGDHSFPKALCPLD